MFTTAKRVYTSFSSIRRPSPAFVIDQFNNLEKEGLGVMKTIHRSPIFFKKVPESFLHEEYKLGKHNTSFQVYKQLFEKTDEFYEVNQRLEMTRNYLGKRMPKGGTISRFLTQFNSHHSSWAPIVWKLRIRLLTLL